MIKLLVYGVFAFYSFFSPASAFAAPFRYDPRDMSVSQTGGYVSPVPNQKRESWCWSYSVTGALEMAMKMGGMEPKDLSEGHLAFTLFANPDSSKRAVFDSQTGNSIPTATEVRRQGSNASISIGPLVRLESPALESDWPLSYANNSASFPSLAVLPPLRITEAVPIVPATMPTVRRKIDIDTTKRLILEKGGVIFYYTHNNDYLHDETAGYYMPIEAKKNHAVLIIGWDDGFAANKFKLTPPGSGAWLARNSWGTDFGKDGYFYISYHDVSIENGTAFSVEPFTPGMKYYGHDALGSTHAMSPLETSGDTNIAWAANIFTADEDIKVTELGVYTVEHNTEVDLSLYVLNGEAPTDGKITAVKKTAFDLPGFHTVKLSPPAIVSSQSKFSVVAKLKAEGGTLIPVECHAEQNVFKNVKVNRRESYFSADGITWIDGYDLPNDNGFSGPANATLIAYALPAKDKVVDVLPNNKPLLDESRTSPNPYDEGGCNAFNVSLLVGIGFLFIKKNGKNNV